MNSIISNFFAEQGYAETTERTYENILTRFLDENPNPADLSAADLLTFIRKPEWENARQCVALSACKKFLTWSYGGHHSALATKIKRIVGKPQRALTAETALRLLASFDPYTPKGSRDLAICALALDTGLRETEICQLQQANTDTDRCVLQALIKGGQWKAAIFTPQTAAHIERWKTYREKLNPQGFLFVSTLKGKRLGKGLTPEGLYNIVSSWGERIGIQLSPHDFRRGMTVIAAENGASDRSLMEMGRWSSTDMPRRYTRTYRLEATRQYLPTQFLGKKEADQLA